MIEKKNNSKHNFILKEAIMTIWKKKLWNDEIRKRKKKVLNLI
jgi:hypothetical protein